jgi:hypothetical protein
MDQRTPTPKLPFLMKIPAAKRELVALFKCFGPGWMLAALVIATLPGLVLAATSLVTALTFFLKAMH